MVKITIAEHITLKFFSLKNYRQIKTPFGFVDETGVLNTTEDPFFGIGLLITQRAPTIYPKFRSLRSKHYFHSELKFNSLTIRSLPLALDFVDALLDSPVSRFTCIFIPKHDKDFDPETYFKNDIFEIYRKFLILLLKESIGKIEILTVLADDYFCPYDDRTLDTFEGGIRAIVNNHHDRLAITGICQINSKSNDFIQLTDLILGCVMLDLKIQKKIVDIRDLSSTKRLQLELLNALKVKLGMKKSGSFFLKNGVFNTSYFNKSPSFRVKVFDPRKAVHIIEKVSHRQLGATLT